MIEHATTCDLRMDIDGNTVPIPCQLANTSACSMTVQNLYMHIPTCRPLKQIRSCSLVVERFEAWEGKTANAGEAWVQLPPGLLSA